MNELETSIQYELNTLQQSMSLSNYSCVDLKFLPYIPFALQVEILEHTIFLRLHASATWFISSCCYKPDIIGFLSFPVWWETLWNYIWNELDCTSILQFISHTLWNIWKARNKEVFKFVPLDPLATSSRISLSRLELQQYGIFAAPPSYTS